MITFFCIIHLFYSRIEAKRSEIYLGITDINTRQIRDRYGIELIQIHEMYNSSVHLSSYDIALIMVCEYTLREHMYLGKSKNNLQ